MVEVTVKTLSVGGWLKLKSNTSCKIKEKAQSEVDRPSLRRNPNLQKNPPNPRYRI